MGVKRPFEEENLPELSFEQRIEDHNNKKLSFTPEDSPSTTAPRFHYPGEFENCVTDGACIMDKESTPSAPLSLAASNGKQEEEEEEEEYAGNIPERVDFRTPSMPPPLQFEDPYIYLLNTPPRKEIPIGPDHQAEVPEWDPFASRKDFSDEREQELMGSCIVRPPGLNGSGRADPFAAGRGRTDCSCMDVGSMRCVQQHVHEAREKLQETIGDEVFVKLGFYDMGEEAASRKWTPDEEQLFHEVVFSNPGGDFWKVLGSVFPNRTRKDFVSYYFNVFMLRRRGAQNRSFMLQIDSDDEEEHKSARELFGESRSLFGQDSDEENDMKVDRDEYFYVVQDEGDEVESLDDVDLDVGWVDEYGPHPENVGGDNKEDEAGQERKSE
ncbi:hypothetical protein ABFS83_12G093200 [Erythranthe nasuta]